jgi:pimeloyl-ACP methyl ester carboxylesterase
LSKLLDKRAVLAACLACLAAGWAWTRIASADAERRHPSGGRMVDADGVPLRLMERGSGPPAVFVHGAWGGPEDWDSTVAPLVEHKLRCLMLERPGHGWSGDSTPEAGTPLEQARLLRAAARAVGADRPLLVGFSYGGSVCAAWAACWPDEVAGVVLVNPALYRWEGIESASFSLASLPLVGDLGVPAFAMPAGLVLSGPSLSKVFAPESPTPGFESSPWRRSLRPPDFRANIRDLRRLKSSLGIQSSAYGRIKAPVRLIAGLGDQVTWADFHCGRMAREVAGVRVLFVEGAGHQLVYTRADVVAREIVELVETGE